MILSQAITKSTPEREKRLFTATAVILWIFISLALSSCAFIPRMGAPDPGVYHLVRPGETLWSIAQTYKIRLQDLTDANRIGPKESLSAGRVLFIPGALKPVDPKEHTVRDTAEIKRPPPPKPPGPVVLADPKPDPVTPDKGVAPETQAESAVAKDEDHKPRRKPLSQIPRAGAQEGVPIDKNRFTWPVNGDLRSRFGQQPDGTFANGVRIAAPVGSPVAAAASGQVIFSSTLRDFGETIIIRHEEHFATVYANLGGRLVNAMDQIKKGDQIALLEGAGRKGEAILHFEIRYRNKAFNPLLFLP